MIILICCCLDYNNLKIKGGLVQHILDTKKDLEGENEKDSLLLSQNENDSKDMIHAKKDVDIITIYKYILLNYFFLIINYN